MSNDRIIFALGAHLPWVRHRRPRADAYEQWLFAAITQTLVPLADRLEKLAREGVPVRVTLSLSPTLLEMLADPLLAARYVDELGRQIGNTESLRDRAGQRSPRREILEEQTRNLRATRRFFCERHAGYLITAFRKLAEAGIAELATSAASGAYLPVHSHCAGVTSTQIRLGVEEFQRHLGTTPAGFWLPGGGFQPELEAPLYDAGVRWVILEQHGVELGAPRPSRGARQPVCTPSGLVAFARTRDLSEALCSAEFETGPGEVLTRPREEGRRGPFEEFAAEFDEGDASRVAVSDTLSEIRTKATAYADDFLERCRERLGQEPSDETPGCLVVALEATRLGQQWPWGMDWLECVFRRLGSGHRGLELATPGDVLAQDPILPQCSPASSSWSPSGYHDSWVCGENDWIYPPLAAAARRMEILCQTHPDATGLLLRALNQSLRELLLAQSGDWAALMTRETTADYAIARTRRHLADFTTLAEQIEADAVEEATLLGLEARDNIFPAIDYRCFLEGTLREKERGEPPLATRP